MTRWIAEILISLAIGVLVVGCDNSKNSSAPDATQSLPELRLGYFANVTHAQAVLGVASGDFQSALGTTHLKTRVFNAGPELIQAINSGDIDIGYVGPGPVLAANASSHGQAVRVIAGAAADGVVIVARQGSGITKLTDLKGKQIATPQLGNTQDISARHYVTAVLGQPDANNVKGIPNSEQSGMMARGLIDAAWVPEPWGARLISDTGATLVGEEKDLWPHGEFSLTVVVTTPQFLAQHPDVVANVLRIHDEWTRRLSVSARQYADQLNDDLAQLTGKKLPSDVLQGALDRTKFTDDPIQETFTTMGQWSYDLKFVKSPPDLTGLFETDLIRGINAPVKGQ